MIEVARDLAKVRVLAPQGDDVGISEVYGKSAATAGELMAKRNQFLIGGGEKRGAEQLEGPSRLRHAGKRYTLPAEWKANRERDAARMTERARLPGWAAIR